MRRPGVALGALTLILGLASADHGAGAGATAQEKRMVQTGSTACQAPTTAFLFENAPVMGMDESWAWYDLSLGYEQPLNPETVVAVVPSPGTWGVRDVRLSSSDGQRVRKAMAQAPYSYNHPTVVAAQLCFTSWYRARVRRLRLIGGEAADRAAHLVRGMYGAGPRQVPPGGTITLLLMKGSCDDTVYRHPFNPAMRWYAVLDNSLTIYAVATTETSVADMDVFELTLPHDAARGSYFLALLQPQLAAHPEPGFMNGELDGDFEFAVQ